MLLRTSVWLTMASTAMALGTAVAAERSDPISTTPAASAGGLTDAEIREILRERIDIAKRGVGGRGGHRGRDWSASGFLRGDG